MVSNFGDIQIQTFFRVIANIADNFYALQATTPHCKQQRRSPKRKNDQGCGQQYRTFFRGVDNNVENVHLGDTAEELPQGRTV
jgi:hypothetical protein